MNKSAILPELDLAFPFFKIQNCKKIIEKMGGSVDVFSEIGVGTEFRIKIKSICKGLNLPEMKPMILEI